MAGSIVIIPGYIFVQILVEEERGYRRWGVAGEVSAGGCLRQRRWRRVGAAPGLSPGKPVALCLKQLLVAIPRIGFWGSFGEIEKLKVNQA